MLDRILQFIAERSDKQNEYIKKSFFIYSVLFEYRIE